MKLPAQKNIKLQDSYPMQAEGGFAGDLHASVHKALVAWEKKRETGDGFRYGKGGSSQFKREKTSASREEISWNKAPEVKKPSRKKERLTQIQKEERARLKRLKESQETPEERKARLAKRREIYLAKHGGVLKHRSLLTPQQKIEARKESVLKYKLRIKAGLVPKTVRKPSKLSPERLAKKAAAQRAYAQTLKNTQ
jgi:hypothetical protein